MINARCPTDAELRILVNRPDSVSSDPIVISHVDECPTCQQRLDAFVDDLPDVLLNDDANRGQSSSEALNRVVHDLKHERYSDFANNVDGWKQLVRQTSVLSDALGKYEAHNVLGQGGMGMVVRATDTALRRDVAIKLITAPATSPHNVERFFREARAMAALKHENVVSIYSIEQEGDLPFLVMEYVAGKSLAQRLADDGPLGVREILKVATDIASALCAAHAANLVHRDLKPGNVLIDSATGQVKVTDFGLAKSDSEAPITTVDVIAGTPEFMAPEQASGDDVDGRADLFSLGTLIYVAFTGRSPFQSDSPLKTLQLIREHEVPPLCELLPETPRWFSDLVAQLMHKQPSMRVQSAEAVKQILIEQQQNDRSRSTLTTLPLDAATLRTDANATRLNPQHTESQAPTLRHYVTGIIVGVFSLLILAVFFGDRLVESLSFLTPDRPSPASPSVATKSNPNDAFWIDGRGSFTSLSSAVAEAKANQTIEIRGDGPHVVEPLEVGPKPIVLRAARGVSPILISSGAVAEPFISTQANLDLRGVEIRWNFASSPGRQRRVNNRRRSVINVEQATLTMSDCRIVSNGATRAGCVSVSKGSLEFVDCHFECPIGNGVSWIMSRNATGDFQNCKLKAKVALQLGAEQFDFRDGLPQLQLSHCKIVGHRAVQFAVFRNTRSLAAVSTHDCEFDCSELCVLVAIGRNERLLNRVTTSAFTEMTKRILRWSEANNSYRSDLKFLSAVVGVRPFDPISAQIETLADWDEIWQQADTKSVKKLPAK